jgi:hypothetical protein
MHEVHDDTSQAKIDSMLSVIYFYLFYFIYLFVQITLIYIQINHKIETIYIGLGTF